MHASFKAQAQYFHQNLLELLVHLVIFCRKPEKNWPILFYLCGLRHEKGL